MKVQMGTFDLQDTTFQVDHDNSYFITPEAMAGDKSYAGFIVGAGDLQTDYRARALTHRSFGKNGGVLAVVYDKKLMFLDMEDSLKQLPSHTIKGNELKLTSQDIILDLKAEKKDTGFVMVLSALKSDDKSLISSISCKLDPAKTGGNIGIVANGSAGNERMYWFKHWKLSGRKMIQDNTQKFGPIVSAMYTIHEQVLKLTAQLTPVGDNDPQKVILEVMENNTGNWEEIAQAKLIVPGYTATFRIADWNRGETRYRIKYTCPANNDRSKSYYYQGIFKANPEDKDEVVVAAFTGNSPAISIYGDYDFSKERIWFPHNDLIPKVEKMNPDLLVYTGDQIYEWIPTQPDNSGNKSSNPDYLYKWYLWCWSHGDLARNIPTVCLLDDHDVFQGNLWGAGGRKAQIQEDGGYIMSPDFVNMVQRTQTSHLPDPYDPTPAKQGIEVYYCDLNWGNIDFAILEDRKFKSGPNTTLPTQVLEKASSTGTKINPAKLDIPSARLLGERQLSFIRYWAKDWENTSMKATLSQTIFAGLFTESLDREKLIYNCDTYPENHRIVFSADANSWPLTPRNQALKEIRKGYAFMIGGDTHLGSIIHHGTDEWGDAGYSFCVPSIANRHVRVWYPDYPGENALDSLPPYTGDYLDKAGAKITVYAVSNSCDVKAEPSKLYDLAPGFGIIRFNKPSKTITMEN